MVSGKYNFFLKRTIKILCLPALLYIIPMIVGITSYINSNNVSYNLQSPDFKSILINNTSCLLKNILGVFTLGLTTIVNLIFNGFSHGLMIRTSINIYGISYTIIKIIPHGLFEIPAIIISGAIGLLPLYYIFVYIFKGKVFLNRKHLIKFISVSLVISFIFLTIGAVIEGI